jgi:hypothetical protein
MVKDRIFKKLYSLPVTLQAGTTTAANKIYLPPAPYLEGIKISAISFKANYLGGSFLSILDYSGCLTLIDNKKEICLDKYPLYDLWDGVSPAGTVAFTPFRLRLFNVAGVVSQDSYINSSINVTTTESVILGSLIFYEK